MKHKMILPFLLFILLILAACQPAAEQVQPDVDVAEAGAPAEEGAPSEAAGGSILPANECDEPGEGLSLLNYPAEGFCFIYPAKYEVYLADDNSSVSLYFRSPMNTEAPALSVEFQAADGRTAEDVSQQLITDFAFMELVPQGTTLGDEPAIMIDNLPGQDTGRRIITLHNDVIFQLSVIRVGADYGEVGEEAEALFSQVTSSFEFIPVEKDKPFVAGPECPEQVEASLLYTNEAAGYCLLLPADYQVLEVSTEADNNEMAFYIDTIQDTSHPKLWINVSDAKGASLEEVTLAHETEIEQGIEGYDVFWSFGFLLDGALANQFDQVPGQDLGRQLIFVHDDQLFLLTFTPDDPEMGAVYDEMVAMYEMVLDSFSFLAN
jgi:hypothetical protein